MASKVEIISDAFINLGNPPVSSPQTDNPLYAAASDIYDHLLPAVLALHTWRFAMKNFELTKLTEESPFGRWQSVFELPSDVLLPHTTDPITNYEIFGRKLYTNEDTIKLEYIFKASEADFPPYFTDAMVLILTARISMSVTQLPNLAAFWEKKGEAALILARSLDSQIMPNPVVVRDEIWSSHFGTGRVFGRFL